MPIPPSPYSMLHHFEAYCLGNKETNIVLGGGGTFLRQGKIID